MEGLETGFTVQKIAEAIGLSPLAVEVGFLLFLTALIIVIVLVVEAIIRIKKEFIKFNLGAGYILHLLTREEEHQQAFSGADDVNPGESIDDIRTIVLRMLQEGKSHDEIKENLDVSGPYIKGVRKWAFDEGTLFQKKDKSTRR